MKQASLSTLITLSAMTLCSACSQQSRTATFVTPASQHDVTVRWDEAVAATSIAHVNNNNLISMR